MSVDPSELKKSGTEAVSKYFRRDWQFIVDYLRTPVLKEASTAIAAAPALLDFNFLNQHVGAGVSKAISFTYTAAVIYILFYLCGYFSCPKFIREYRDFGEYDKRKHSKRFIGWELMNALRVTRDEKLIDELIEKGLLTRVAASDTSKILATALPRETVGKYTVLGPNNVGIDLYIYFRTGSAMYKLFLKEHEPDPDDTTQRVLFWVMYTTLTKSKPIWRYATWLLFNAAIGIFLLSVIVSVYRAI
jgi:hypothetical protein